MGKERRQCFAGRHFDREVILLCVRWHLRYKLSLRDLVEMMAERGLGLFTRPSCVGSNGMSRSSKRAGLAMHAKLAAPGRRRDISEGARPMGLSLPCRGQGGQYSRLPAESKERRCGGQGVLPQGAPHPRARSHQHYAGWLCCIASRSARDVERKRGMETPQAAIIEIPEQSD